MLDKNNDTTGHESRNAAITPALVNPGRRRFNAAGIAASGVMMTVASRSVLAEGTCNAAGPSGVGSVHTSAAPNGTVPLTCGLSPGAWMTKDQGFWPIPFTDPYSGTDPDSHLKGVFGIPAGFPAPMGSSKPGSPATFKEVIDFTSNGQGTHGEFYRHIAAQYLNLLKYPSISKYLTLDQLKAMATLTFAYPAGSTLWDETKVKAYLTQIQS